jgi:hypothetical protein
VDRGDFVAGPNYARGLVAFYLVLAFIGHQKLLPIPIINQMSYRPDPIPPLKRVRLQRLIHDHIVIQLFLVFVLLTLISPDNRLRNTLIVEKGPRSVAEILFQRG